MAALEPRFAALWQRCLLPGRTAGHFAAWGELATNYVEPSRRYHSHEHLRFCLREFDTARALMAAPDALEMAIWFHDVILVPGARDNELRSSILFADIVRGHFDADFVAGVSSLILATTHREEIVRGDAQFACDIDLASMGFEWPLFLSDCHALRAEESHRAADAYAAAKLRFFDALLARRRIFHTDFFHARYENSARANIARFSAMLRAGDFS